MHDHLIVASGFNCREQIAQSMKRKAVHLSEVMAMALHQGEPEAATAPQRASAGWRPVVAAASAAVLTFAVVAWLRRR